VLADYAPAQQAANGKSHKFCCPLDCPFTTGQGADAACTDQLQVPAELQLLSLADAPAVQPQSRRALAVANTLAPSAAPTASPTGAPSAAGAVCPGSVVLSGTKFDGEYFYEPDATFDSWVSVWARPAAANSLTEAFLIFTDQSVDPVQTRRRLDSSLSVPWIVDKVSQSDQTLVNAPLAAVTSSSTTALSGDSFNGLSSLTRGCAKGQYWLVSLVNYCEQLFVHYIAQQSRSAISPRFALCGVSSF
jgi:hypothetical protein